MEHQQRMPTRLVIGAISVILVLMALFAIGCPQYKVYKRGQDGEAALKEAESSKKVQLEEAKANLESEKLNAQAEVARAKGAAEAIAIEAGKLTPEYIQYLWVRQNTFNDKTTIYIPTEANLPILEGNPSVRSAP